MAELAIRETAGQVQCLVTGELTIYQAAGVREQLAALVNEHSNAELDLAGVTEFDSAGVQLLLVLKQKARQLGGEWALVNHAQAVTDVLETLNLAAQLGDPLLLTDSGNGGQR